MNEYFPDRQLYPLQRERLREKEPQANCANPQKRGEREWAGCVGGILHGPMVGVKVNLMEASEKSKLPPCRSRDHVERQRAMVSGFSVSFQICRAVFVANWQFHSLTFCGDSVSAKDAGQLMVAGGCKSAFHCY